MQKNILLDRFIAKSVKSFYKFFSKNYKVSIISYYDGNPHLRNKTTLLFDDHLISNGYYLRNISWTLNNSELKFINSNEGLFLNLLSRFLILPSNWSVREMSTHIIQLVNFWKYYVNIKKIHACFSFNHPHTPSSFALYILCKFLKIPYIFIDRPLIANRFKFMSCSFEERNILIKNKFSVTTDDVKQRLQNYQSTITSNFNSSVPYYMINFNKKFTVIQKIYYCFNILKKNKYSLFRIIFRLVDIYFPKSPKHLKFNKYEWFSKFSTIGRIKYFFIRKEIKKRINSLKEKYNSLCVYPENFKKKLEKKQVKINYLYFAAHLSPEATLIPTGLWNMHQDIAITRVLQNMPKNWKIVYKANPAQFDFNKRKRSSWPEWYASNYYEKLNSTGQVIFVPINSPTDELIKNSRGVLTVNGTVALEAVALRKRCIIFSDNWYSAIDGVHLCKNNHDISKALNLMISNIPPNPKFSSTKLADSSIFDIGSKYIRNDYTNNKYRLIGKKFLSSLKIFKKLPNKKWKI